VQYVFRTLGIELGAAALRAEAERLGFNRDFDFDGVRLSPSGFTLKEGDGEGDIARAAIGQHEDLVTPLHMALLAGAVANGGVMVKPGLLLATAGRTAFGWKRTGR
jgi:peptidoglycan glycosyltransferase